MAFREIDVTTLDDPGGELRALTGGMVATPTVVIGKDARVGYNPEWMSERLST